MRLSPTESGLAGASKNHANYTKQMLLPLHCAIHINSVYLDTLQQTKQIPTT